MFLAFRKCDPSKRKTCKSDDEINEWLKDKYILFGYNKNVFITDGFKERSFLRYTMLDWVNYDIKAPLVTPYSTQIIDVITDDNYFPSGSHN